MLGQIDALPRTERESPPITGTWSDTPVSMVFNAPACRRALPYRESSRQPRVQGARAHSQDRCARLDRHLDDREAEVCRARRTSAPSFALLSVTNCRTSRVISAKVLPLMSITSVAVATISGTHSVIGDNEPVML